MDYIYNSRIPFFQVLQDSRIHTPLQSSCSIARWARSQLWLNLAFTVPAIMPAGTRTSFQRETGAGANGKHQVYAHFRTLVIPAVLLSGPIHRLKSDIRA